MKLKTHHREMETLTVGDDTTRCRAGLLVLTTRARAPRFNRIEIDAEIAVQALLEGGIVLRRRERDSYSTEALPKAHACALQRVANLLETVPTVLHILMRHAGNPKEAIIRAVNDTKDSDSIAAIVGAAVGALHGCAQLPDRWKQDLLGRTQERDDGRIFELIDQSIRRFGPAAGDAAIV
jgi:ADP-ribosylglycohydrolase